jgi:hypothetical protein
MNHAAHLNCCVQDQISFEKAQLSSLLRNGRIRMRSYFLLMMYSIMIIIIGIMNTLRDVFWSFLSLLHPQGQTITVEARTVLNIFEPHRKPRLNRRQGGNWGNWAGIEKCQFWPILGQIC